MVTNPGKFIFHKLNTNEKGYLPDYDYANSATMEDFSDIDLFYKRISIECKKRDPKGIYDFTIEYIDIGTRIYKIGGNVFKVGLADTEKQKLLETTLCPNIDLEEEREIANYLGTWHPGHPDNYGNS